MGSLDSAAAGRSGRSWMTLRCVSWAVFLFWQAVILLLLWQFSSFIHLSTRRARSFDVAGKQRLLAQQVHMYVEMVQEGHREDRGRLMEHAALFESGLLYLERDVQNHGRLRLLEGEKVSLAAVRSFWDPYRLRLENIARLPASAKDFPAACAAARAEVPRLVEVSDAFTGAAVDASRIEYRRMRMFLLVLGALNLFVSSLGLRVFHRWFLQPMEVLQLAIGRFEDGNFSARAQAPLHGEMSSLIAAFNSMAQSVDRNTRELRAVLDNSPAVIFIKDLESRYVFVNRRFETLFHQAHGAMTGKTDLDVFPQEAAENFRAADQEVLRCGEAMTIAEDIPQDDGTHNYLSVKFPLRDSAGAPYGLCGIATDVTDKKLVEEQLRQSQKMDAVGRLAGGVAHDFNNILTAILGYCTLLRDQVPSAAARADLDEIRTAGERAAALTKQLLVFSRKQTLSPKVLSLNAIVADTERMLKRVLGENVALACRLSPELGYVKADKSQLEQVILNLAVNARDAMPGGGSLTIETANRELDEEYCKSHPESRPGRHAMLTVTDTGTGMDAGTRARIFEPFFTTKEEGRGTGLGLSMVYGIVRQSGGHVDVLSEPGRGASFQIFLPIVAEAPAAEYPTPVSAFPGAGEVVLLVEDEEPLRRLVVRILSKAGYAVIEAGDAETAVALFQERGSEVRLLLTDVVLPKKDGWWLAEKLLELDPSLRVLYTSGYVDKVIGHDGVLDGGAKFLPKPFTAESLLSAVRAVLDA